MSARGGKLPVAELLNEFDASVCAFDCGQLCAPLNGGVPVCCESDGVVPVLYREEFALLRSRGDLWRAFKPTCAHERNMEEELSDYQLAICTRSCVDERENRSLNCRSFPFLPYFDHDDELCGLVYDYESAEGKCPLVELPQVITREYIRQAIWFWGQVCSLDEDEGAFYRGESEALRRRMGRRGEKVPVLVEEGLLHMPTQGAEWRALQKDGGQPYLEVFQRP